MTPGLPYQWQQRCRAAFYAELATGLTSDEIMAFIQCGASCPWESTETRRARIEAETYLHIFYSAERVRYTVSAGTLHPFYVHRQTFTDGGVWWCPAGREWWSADTEDEAVEMASERAEEEAARWYAAMCEAEIDQARHYHEWEMARADVAGGVGDEVPFD